MEMGVHAFGRTTWHPHVSHMRKTGPPSRPLTHLPDLRGPPPDKPLPPPPLFAFADFDTDTLGAARPSTKVPGRHSSPGAPINADSLHQSELKRQDSGVAIELEDEFSSFVASSPSIFKESVLGGINVGSGSGLGMSASPPSLAERRAGAGAQGTRSRSANRKSMGPRLPVRVMSADSNGGLGEPSLKVVERPLTPSTPGDSSVRLSRMVSIYVKHVAIGTRQC